MKPKYELDWQNFTKEDLENNYVTVKVLTGAEFDDIEIARKEVWRLAGRKDSRAWYGQSFIQVFRMLGFNTSKFIKFDPDTDKPCIMRCKYLRDESHWHAFIYHDGLVNNRWTLEEWRKSHIEKYWKITSMLQVWI